MSETELQFLADWGVYGLWLLKYGKEVPKDNIHVQRMMKWYTLYYKRPEHCSQAIIMSEIDAFCKECDFIKPNLLSAELYTILDGKTL